uniref:Uncharacterized protein n=1 Tax=Tanacetum cinerariifolium TaxID=118510 RepID=A0A6L2KDX9_TANCI|nr:hypothetical protein [Tanacetum cinerariifolium]
MKQTEHYQMYAEVFGIDVPLIQSPPTESTQGTHRSPSAPRSPTLKVDASASTRSTMIRLRLPQRKSTHLTPPGPVLMVDKADELIFQDRLQVSLAEHKSRQEQEARENMALVEKHLASEEIEKMGHYGYLFEHLRAKFMPRKSFVTLVDHLLEAMADSLPTMVDKHIKEQVLVYVAEGLILERQKTKEEMEKMIAKAILQERNQEQANDYDFWTDSYASDDDEIPTKQVLQDIMNEVSLNVDEAKLKKITDEMLRQICTSGDEHQYHIDQKVNLTALTISFPEVKKHEMISIIYEPMHGIIYKNSKKEKRVIRHSEIHKFYDATLNKVLEGLKSYNNDVSKSPNLPCCKVLSPCDVVTFGSEFEVKAWGYELTCLLPAAATVRNSCKQNYEESLYRVSQL